MSAEDQAVLSKLSDSDQTVAIDSTDIRGRTVRDKHGDEIGRVTDLLIDEQERRVRFLLVEHGGFLGIGREKSFLPVDAITEVTADDVMINHSREDVSNAPGYDPDLVEESSGYDKSYLGGISGHYGYLPFWGAGYAYPAIGWI